jgi:CBS domain-containing protein
MSEKSVGALMVMEGDRLVGVISERDYARHVVLKGRSSIETPVRDIMSTKIVHAEPALSVQECLALMTERRVRHLPVMNGPEVVGVVSIGDLVKAIITDQRITIEQLERYIKG